MSIYPIPYANEYDQSNVWPLTGKQITFGIVELGFFSISYQLVFSILEKKIAETIHSRVNRLTKGLHEEEVFLLMVVIVMVIIVLNGKIRQLLIIIMFAAYLIFFHMNIYFMITDGQMDGIILLTIP